MTSMFPIEGGERIHVPFDKAAAAAGEVLDQTEATTVFQTFECGHCGLLTHTLEANAFEEFGHCPECRKTTNLRDTGCGFTVVVGDPEEVISAAADAACGEAKGNA